MTKFTDVYTIRNFHTGPNGLVTVPYLLHFLYEAAGDHCVEEDITIHDLQEIGLTWMLSRMNVEFSAIPSFGDQITITTWPTGAQGLYSCRDFLVTDSEGNPIIKATSAWLTIDLEKRRVVRLPNKVLDIHPNPESAERIIEDNFKGKIEEPAGGIITTGFRADYSTLDVNSHVTSAVYIRWILDALPPELLTSRQISNLEIIHKAEILPGEEAEAEYILRNNTGIHCVRPAGGGPVNCLVKTVWKD